MKYSFANAKPVNLRKIDYWFRVGQCGCHKVDFKPTLREIRGRAAEKKKSQIRQYRYEISKIQC